MAQEPPPYPGIDPNLQPYQPPPGAGMYPPAGANGYQAPPYPQGGADSAG